MSYSFSSGATFSLQSFSFPAPELVLCRNMRTKEMGDGGLVICVYVSILLFCKSRWCGRGIDDKLLVISTDSLCYATLLIVY